MRKKVFLAFLLCISAAPVVRGDDIETAGDVLMYALPASAVALIDIYGDGQGVLPFAEAGILTGVVTYGLKETITERRPNGAGYSSFPSGHTSCAFWSAEFIRKRYRWEYGAPAYTLAAFVGYSRIEANKHYPKDVLAGAAIGFISSFIFTTPYKDWKLEPELSSDYYGLRLSRLW